MKIRTLLPLALSVAALGGATTAMAGGPDNMPTPPSEHHLYVGAGMTLNDSVSDLSNADFAAATTAGAKANNSASLGWKVFVGYQLKSWLDTELSFTAPHSNTVSDVAAAGGINLDSLKSRYYYLDLDAIAKADIYDGLYGFVKGGAGMQWADYNATTNLNNFPGIPGHAAINGVPPQTSASAHMGTFNYGAGLGYKFMNTYGARVSYTHYVTTARITGFDIVPNIWSFDLSYDFTM